MRRKTVVFSAILVAAGIALLELSIGYWVARVQIGYEENPGASNTLEVFLEAGQKCQIEIIVDQSDVGGDFNITITQVETAQLLTQELGTVQTELVPQFIDAQRTGHYEVDWNGLNVSRITAYRLDDLIPKYPVAVAGVSVFMAGIVSFLGFEWKELFEGKKTGVFWWGLMILGLALSGLFALLWYGFVAEQGTYMWQLSAPWIFGCIIFLLIGLYMMKPGTKKRNP